MASIYDFLNSSILFDTSLQEERYKNVSDKRLLAELEKYRTFCLENLEELAADAKGPAHTLRMFGDRRGIRHF